MSLLGTNQFPVRNYLNDRPGHPSVSEPDFSSSATSHHKPPFTSQASHPQLRKCSTSFLRFRESYFEIRLLSINQRFSIAESVARPSQLPDRVCKRILLPLSLQKIPSRIFISALQALRFEECAGEIWPVCWLSVKLKSCRYLPCTNFDDINLMLSMFADTNQS